MPSWSFENLRGFQGKRVRLTSTEGEGMLARVLSVDDEHQDLVVDVLSTNRPEAYERMGRRFDQAGWVIPFEFIAHIVADD